MATLQNILHFYFNFRRLKSTVLVHKVNSCKSVFSDMSFKFSGIVDCVYDGC